MNRGHIYHRVQYALFFLKKGMLTVFLQKVNVIMISDGMKSSYGVTFTWNAAGLMNAFVDVKQDAYLAYGDRLSASAMTLKTDTDNRYRFNGKERHDWAGYPYIDYGARMYNPLIGSWLSPDPLADKYTSTSPYVFCAGDPVNYVDKKGEFPLAANIAGAVVAMATDYVSQAVANVIVNGFSIDAFTRDIDLIDIGVAGVEGFLTMGTSAIKNATVKTVTRAAVSATSAAISNTINYKVSDQEITYNPVEQVVTGTMVGRCCCGGNTRKR